MTWNGILWTGFQKTTKRCALHDALRPHAEPLEALRAQLRWCVVHLQALAEQLRRTDEPEPPPAAGLGDAGYESTVYGRVENDWVMASR